MEKPSRSGTLLRSILTTILCHCNRNAARPTGVAKGNTKNKMAIFPKKPQREAASLATARLRRVGLRPTRQRVELASLLLTGSDRHVTAESLHDEVNGAGMKVSLATVYNTLHQFTAAGLLRQVVVDAARGYFDTNTGDH